MATGNGDWIKRNRLRAGFRRQEDFTHVKFYRLSLRASVELGAGRVFDGFHHVDGWDPQRIVTATGPNPLPR